MKTWPTATIRFTKPGHDEGWEIAVAHLMELEGCLGSEEFEFHPSGFPACARLTFPSDVELAAIRTAVEEAIALHLPECEATITVDQAVEEDWVTKWREHFHRVPVTPTLYVGPPEEVLDFPEGDGPRVIYVKIEPGSAFGTGTHPTTQGVLTMLEGFLRGGGEKAPRSVLDIGAGSGVLSIAAIMLGAREAVALERDPVAEENFRFNVRLNGVEEQVRLVSGATVEALAEDVAPDLVLCNMISTEFEPLLAGLARFGAPLLLSGFLREEEKEVRRLLAETGWAVHREIWLEDWGTFHADVL